MITSLARGFAGMVLRLAPGHSRETLLGDLLEEQEVRAGSRPHAGAALWLVRECARSAVPLALWRARRAGPVRVALACAGGLAAAAAVHTAAVAAWHSVLALVPLCALHDAPLAWRVVAALFEIVAALLGAWLIVKSGTARKGGRT